MWPGRIDSIVLPKAGAGWGFYLSIYLRRRPGGSFCLVYMYIYIYRASWGFWVSLNRWQGVEEIARSMKLVYKAVRFARSEEKNAEMLERSIQITKSVFLHGHGTPGGF